MAVMLAKTYDALIAAGAPGDKARDAAEELAYEARFARIEIELTVIKRMLWIAIAGVASLASWSSPEGNGHAEPHSRRCRDPARLAR
jgi:hypothetical protein